MGKLYLAYGANLNKRAMKFRCPTARPLGKVMVKDCELVFRGVADLQYAPGKEAPCGLWLINKADEEAMDRFEGVRGDKGMYIKQWIPIRRHGRWTTALIYKMLDDGISPPGQGYAETIRQGYYDFGMNPAFLDGAIKFAVEHTAHSAQTLDRKERHRKADRDRHITLVKMTEEASTRRAELLKAKREEYQQRPVLTYRMEPKVGNPIRDVERGSLFPEHDLADARRHAHCTKCGTVHHFRGACPDFFATTAEP
jgi:hypothetical protein